MPIAFLAPLLLAAGTADVAKLDCPAIYAKTDYTDDTDLCLPAPMTKPAFEEGMTCIGKFDGSRAMADRKARMAMSTWEVETEVSDQESVLFRVGFVRVANRVAEVGFAPTGGNDMTARDFFALVRRAGARLGELR